MKSLSLRCLVLAGAVLFTAHAQAAYVWLDRDASGESKAYLGELNGKKEATSGLSLPRAYLADGRELQLTTRPDAIAISTPLIGDLRFSARTLSNKGAAHFYMARFGRAETQAVNELEIVPTTANGNAFKVIWKGAVMAVNQLNVTTAEGWTRVLKPEADGSYKLPISFPGLYVLEVQVKLTGALTIDGKQYDDVLYSASLSFNADARR